MTERVYKTTPVLKIGEWSVEQGGGAYVSFDEQVDIPGLETASIRLEFKDSSFENIKSLTSLLKEKGLVFVVQK